MHTKRLLTAAVTALVLQMALPVAAADVRVGAGADASASAGANAGLNFCTRISFFSTDLGSRLVDLRAKLDTRISQRKTDLAEREAGHDARLVEAKKHWLDNRTEAMVKLQAKATTDTQKAGLVTFKTSMEAAVSAHLRAVDAAVATFRTGLKQLAAERKTAEESIASDYRASVQAAFAKAKSDCASGVAAATVRANLIASLEAAKNKMQSDRQALEKIGAKVEALVKARVDAVAKANADFKASAGAARVQLKASWDVKANVK